MSSIVELDRWAVVTLQGGGVYGLTLAGQLHAAVTEYGVVPVAVAGTSAGAIVATLYWAGYTPEGILQIFGDLARANQLVPLLGPFEPPERPVTFRSVAKLREALSTAWRSMRSESDLPLTKRNLAQVLPSAALHAWSIWSDHGTIFKSLEHRGIFRGDTMEERIAELIWSAPVISKYRRELGQIMGHDRTLRFGHIRQLEDRIGSLAFPALFITATDMHTRRIAVINSVDEKFSETPIARAVRASAGFPLFFRPVDVQIEDKRNWFVDGGVISNYPTWVFGQELRRQMAVHPRFRAIAQRPWMHVGLRRAPDTPDKHADIQQFGPFVQSLTKLLTGGARDNLEDLLANTITPHRNVAQPVETTGGPKDVLDVASIDEAKVREMFDKGMQYARSALAPLTFSVPNHHAQQINLELESLGKRADNLFEKTSFRTNLYLPRDEKLYRRFWHNMPASSGFGFEFDQGQTGYCFTFRVPMILNRQALFEAARRDQLGNNHFGMSAKDHLKGDQTMTWLLSIPVFDPNEFAMVPSSLSEVAPTSSDVHLVLPRVLDGVIYGVLNVEAQLGYAELQIDPTPSRCYTDIRVQTLVDLARVSAARIGRILAICFGGKDRNHG